MSRNRFDNPLEQIPFSCGGFWLTETRSKAGNPRGLNPAARDAISGNALDPEARQRLREAALPTHDEVLSAPDEMSRREALAVLMAASSALALGISGCERKPRRQIVSRVMGPEYQKPGEALYYSSTWTEGSYPYGLMIKTVDGRPIKIEGNPDHPVNLGATSAAMQASILSLYDPDRLRGPQDQAGAALAWSAVDERVVEALRAASSVVLLTRSSLGPTERELVARFMAVKPGLRHFVHEPLHDRPRRLAWQRVYGSAGDLLPRFDRARVILSLDSDFLGTDGIVLENIRQFAAGRQLHDAEHGQAEMSRLYVAEGAMTVTGSNADHRLRLRPSALGTLARALLDALDGHTSGLSEFTGQHRVDEMLLRALVEDLEQHRGEVLVVAGPHLPADVHAAVAQLNDKLGAAGNTLSWSPVQAHLPVSDPGEIEAAFANGVDVAVLLDVNPVYDWPGGGFGELLKRAPMSVGHSLNRDETLSACTLALPSSHNLESWNDAAPRDGLHSICQPVIAPLFDTRQPAESLLRWTQALARDGNPIKAYGDWHVLLKSRFVARVASTTIDGGELAWQDALRAGGVFREVEVVSFPKLERLAVEEILHGQGQTETPAGEYELVIQPHHALADGRFANNGWLQELPDPVSKVVWDNFVSISQQTADRLGVVEGGFVAVKVGQQAVELPALIQPGMADDVVGLTLGHGRTAGGVILDQASGVSVAGLLGSGSPSVPRCAFDVKVTKVAGARKPVRTQKEFSRHDRPIVLHGTLADYRKDAAFVTHQRHLPDFVKANGKGHGAGALGTHEDAHPHEHTHDDAHGASSASGGQTELLTMYPPYDYAQGHKWALAIDLGACVGCNACVTACQAENNIPIVGRAQVAAGREMHWLRIDRYLDGDTDDPVVHQQPMLCQQCDNAPCESVCPVNATSHSPDGLNEMTYNRCVGTRYCSNNCPYKVRRFNFLRYQQAQLRDPVQELAFNPQVTVRGVGVMEKCTFCVQRINAAKFAALNTGKPIVDGTVQTACQQVCPAQAIVFGDLNDPASKVAQLHRAGRVFFVLEELNVRPNVAYLARVRNPHPLLAGSTTTNEGHHG